MCKILWRMKMQRMEKSNSTIRHTNSTPRQEVKSYLLCGKKKKKKQSQNYTKNIISQWLAESNYLVWFTQFCPFLHQVSGHPLLNVMFWPGERTGPRWNRPLRWCPQLWWPSPCHRSWRSFPPCRRGSVSGWTGKQKKIKFTYFMSHFQHLS